MEDLLREAIHTAKKSWPGIILDEVEFGQCLRERLAGASDPARALAELCVDDLYLAQACARGDTRALEQFDQRFLEKVEAFLARHRARGAADEVRQLLRERLLLPRPEAPPRIAEYSGRGPLAAWLRVATLRAASNLARGDKPHVEIDDGVMAGAIADAPELRLLQGEFGPAFREAFRHAFAALEADERALLKLHFVDGVSVRKLAPILGVSSATAGRRLLAAQERLGDTVLVQLGERIQASPAELASVVKALLSRLDISLATLIGAR